ncbi:11769_t:CDS:1, partial [Funneliformis geosporum]
LDSIDWILKEALLAYKKINRKYTGENIYDVIEQIIRQFQLEQKLFIAIIDNDPNIVKAIRLIEISHTGG